MDDSATNRFLLKAILNNQGYECQESDNGAEAIALCLDNKPAMVLLDVMMPGLDGMETCRRLRERYAQHELPIMIVTTRSEGQDVADALSVGANDYVAKPIDRVVLLARVAHHLSVCASRRELDAQRKETERALSIQSAIGDVLPEAIAVHDASGVLIYANKQLQHWCGNDTLGSIKEILSKIFGGTLRQALSDLEARVCAEVRLVVDEELSAPDGRKVRVLSKPVPVDETLVLRLWLWDDVTAMRDLERRLNQQVKLETVALFSSGVAHNFNNIMGGILGAAEVLSRLHTKDEKSARCLNVIKRGVQNGVKLTEQMSGLVRKEMGFGSEGVLTLKGLLQHLFERQSGAVAGRVSFQMIVPEELPALELDSMSLLEIFSNVLSNAVDAISDRGEVKVDARWSDSRNALIVSIRDNGCGMDQATIEKVFDPFFSTKKMDEVNGVSVAGHGLGLWKVYSLLKAFGGDISISSAVGQGTEVRISLPLQAYLDTGSVQNGESKAARPEEAKSDS